MSMVYNYGTGADTNWIVGEDSFDPSLLGKGESVFVLGNGYMGLRSTTEERYMGETRNMFVAGTFNKFAESEVTELPNAADVLNMEFALNGERFDLTQGKILSYKRYLHLKQAQLTRELTWQSPAGKVYELLFQRFVSFADRHLIASKVSITPKQATTLHIKSGIDGRMSNSGTQHFVEGPCRFYDKRYMQLTQTTTESGIDFVYTSNHQLQLNGQVMTSTGEISMDRRQMFMEYTLDIPADTTFVLEKQTSVFTSRDKDLTDAGVEAIKAHALAHIKVQGDYDSLLEAHMQAWEIKVWQPNPVMIETTNDYDQLAIRFAQYHLHVMTPAHDNRMNIGAKGLSGEGYKGHTFWDTELFMLPYFTYTHPNIARSLLEYRYLSLPGAHKKATENGYEGAMFPWESAWLEDGEVTPVWGAADIVTGESIKIMSGFIEQHITSDVAFGTWQYYQITGDVDFMERYGYELLMDTAKFWASRLNWSDEQKCYHINDIMGPDEYKEHIDNNAFTNYTAHWNIKKAMEYYHLLKADKPALFDKLNAKMQLDTTYAKWAEKVDKIYLPQPRPQDLVIPQDDTYLSKKLIDLSKYKNQTNVGSIFKDYNLDQINEIQVSKQADIMILFYLLEDLFTAEVKKANWEYYEPKTLHDSSLSLSTHSILANDLGNYPLAYELFKRATEIDLGPNMKTSDAGIHGASLGGIWQCTVNGFGGVRMLNGQLRISPKLPQAWRKLTFPIHWAGDKLEVSVTHDSLAVTNQTGNNPAIDINVHGTVHTLTTTLTVNLS